MTQAIIDLLNQGQCACTNDRFRKGNIISLPSTGSLVVTGDIHGHRRNFERIVAFADLAHHPNRHVLLQEIIHGGSQDEQGGCLSYQLLFDVVRYKLSFPDRVHIIMGNHDTAFINNAKVMKAGREMNQAMRAALLRSFGPDSDDVILALRQFLFSQPLVVKCANRIWISHSLPADRYLDKFDTSIFERRLRISDVVRPGSAYLLTWGRAMSQKCFNKLAKTLDVDIFILGHQPQAQGFLHAAENAIILASDHNHGCLLPIDLARFYSVEELIDSIVPLASIS